MKKTVVSLFVTFMMLVIISAVNLSAQSTTPTGPQPTSQSGGSVSCYINGGLVRGDKGIIGLTGGGWSCDEIHWNEEKGCYYKKSQDLDAPHGWTFIAGVIINEELGIYACSSEQYHYIERNIDYKFFFITWIIGDYITNPLFSNVFQSGVGSSQESVYQSSAPSETLPSNI